jgi:hypothetical protein
MAEVLQATGLKTKREAVELGLKDPFAGAPAGSPPQGAWHAAVAGRPGSRKAGLTFLADFSVCIDNFFAAETPQTDRLDDLLTREPLAIGH